MGAGIGGGYGISLVTNKTNPEIEKEHEIVIPKEHVEGFTITCDKANAKMGDVVEFTVTTNSNEQKVPKAIRLFATNDKGEEVFSDYPLTSTEPGVYIAQVTITYISNVRTELIFDDPAKMVVSFDSNGGSAIESNWIVN